MLISRRRYSHFARRSCRRCLPRARRPGRRWLAPRSLLYRVCDFCKSRTGFRGDSRRRFSFRIEANGIKEIRYSERNAKLVVFLIVWISWQLVSRLCVY